LFRISIFGFRIWFPEDLMSIFDRFRLDGKRLFITGGSRGLGREMALAIAEAGADVILTGRDADSLAATATDIRALGRQAWTVQADVSVAGPCEDACRAALAHGPIDILINNVGGRRENIATEDMPLEKWRELMDLNLTSAFLCTRIIGAAVLARGRGRDARHPCPARAVRQPERSCVTAFLERLAQLAQTVVERRGSGPSGRAEKVPGVELAMVGVDASPDPIRTARHALQFFSGSFAGLVRKLMPGSAIERHPSCGTSRARDGALVGAHP
jgi:hypothetical protein